MVAVFRLAACLSGEIACFSVQVKRFSQTLLTVRIFGISETQTTTTTRIMSGSSLSILTGHVSVCEGMKRTRSRLAAGFDPVVPVQWQPRKGFRPLPVETRQEVGLYWREIMLHSEW